MKVSTVLVGAYVATIAGVALWAFANPKSFTTQTRKGRKKVEKETGIRLPRPEMEIQGPLDEEDFDTLDEVICESALEADMEMPEILKGDQKAYVNLVTARALAKLLPEFPWPAVTGDHTTASELQGIVQYEVRRSILEGTLCLTEDAEDEDEDTEEDFIPPPGE